jgi:hypothetical protein
MTRAGTTGTQGTQGTQGTRNALALVLFFITARGGLGSD